MEKSAITSTIIGVLGGIIGVCIGQAMGASVESDKYIREKIQESYYRVLGLPELAEEFHSSALNKVTPQSMQFYIERYEKSRERYASEINYIVSISDLYERSLSVQTLNISKCSQKFTAVVSNHMLLEMQASGKTLESPLRSYRNVNEPLTWGESVQKMVDLKLECDKGLNTLKSAIVNSMQKHL